MASQCALLALPFEIRTMIYEQLLVPAIQPVTLHNTKFDRPQPNLQFHLSILITCKQINEEAIALFYNQNIFNIKLSVPRQSSITSLLGLDPGAKTCLRKAMQRMKHFEISTSLNYLWSDWEIKWYSGAHEQLIVRLLEDLGEEEETVTAVADELKNKSNHGKTFCLVLGEPSRHTPRPYFPIETSRPYLRTMAREFRNLLVQVTSIRKVYVWREHMLYKNEVLTMERQDTTEIFLDSLEHGTFQGIRFCATVAH